MNNKMRNIYTSQKFAAGITRSSPIPSKYMCAACVCVSGSSVNALGRHAGWPLQLETLRQMAGKEKEMGKKMGKHMAPAASYMRQANNAKVKVTAA